MNELREDVIEAMVAWRLSRKGPEQDPERQMWALIDDATFDELLEAMLRLAHRHIQ